MNYLKAFQEYREDLMINNKNIKCIFQKLKLKFSKSDIKLYVWPFFQLFIHPVSENSNEKFYDIQNLLTVFYLFSKDSPKIKLKELISLYFSEEFYNFGGECKLEKTQLMLMFRNLFNFSDKYSQIFSQLSSKKLKNYRILTIKLVKFI